MPNTKKIIIYSVIALVALFVVVKLIKIAHPAWTRYRLKSMVAKMEPWTATPDYSEAGWKQAVKTAKAFQKVDYVLATEALTGYLAQYANDADRLTEAQGKAFLLLRVIFEAPESGGARLPFAQWERGQTDVNQNGSLNLAWPLMWNEGRPRLVAGRQGTAGSTYSIATEYDYFRYNFKPRDLSKVSW